MSMRPRTYLAAVVGTTLVGTLVASPAWAAGLAEARRGFGIGRALGLVCCLVVVGLVAVGLVIGLMVGRRRRGGS
ncbi:MAG TPA: hypothetical protein VGP31_17160 [Planosporangium sp.]|jgi:hypothetical protein|nr:hypothetical protein [Planosporangium sp.]